MIQIAAAIKPGADIASSADVSSGGDAASSFLALFARTLSAQDGASAQAATLPVAALLDASGQAGSGGTAKNTADSAGSTDSRNHDPALDLNNLSLMQSLVMPAITAVQDKTITLPGNAVSDKTAGIAAQGQDAGKGKSLPNLMATLAGQRDGSQLQVQSDPSSQANLGGANQNKPDANFLAVLTAKAGEASITLGQTQTKPANQSTTDSQAVSAIPMAGQVSLPAPLPQATVVQEKPVIAMQSGFGSPGWSQELGDKVVWMSNSQGHTSQLVLNPPSLGAVEVRLQLNGADAGAQFYSANADVRNAIEAAMPKLREMLAGAGISLGETTVSNQSFSQQGGYQQPQQKSSDSSLLASVAGVGATFSSSSIKGGGTSLLDYYA
jgi:flagellar hook-length control protein FliK